MVGAFNAGNLGPVAQALRVRFPNPNSRLVLCADDDVALDGNPGLTKATEAAQAVAGLLVVPGFGENRDPAWTDFHDLATHRGREAVWRAIASPAATAAEVLQAFQKWLHLPDDDHGSVYVPLAAVAANYLDSDPVWLMTIRPPSGGKTEVIFAIASLPNVHMAATLTEASLLSGTPKKQSVGKGGLLREIGKFGILPSRISRPSSP